MHLVSVCIGFLVGATVAATGIGGGAILTPLLILVLKVPPLSAVGTSLVFMFFAKAWAVLLHWKQKTVDFRLAGNLALGSIPGALLGSSVLAFAQSRLGERLNVLLSNFIGFCLIAITILLLVVEIRNGQGRWVQSIAGSARRERYTAIWIGMAGGFLVTLTSVGSGSVIILFLIVMCPRRPSVLVGTDLFHAVLLSGFAALLHFGVEPVDFRLVAILLAGCAFGTVVGVRLAVQAPPVWLRRVLLTLIAVAGVMMF
jgi:uncharacterized membrane protein YfcA